MRAILAILTLMLSVSSATVAHAYGLEEALAAAPSRPDAVNARLALLNARNDLLRAQGDPLALKMDLVKAQQAVALQRATLHESIADALVDITGAYTGVLEAREGHAIAVEAAALSQTALHIAEIRRANGTGTDLDVQDAQVSLDKATSDAATARKSLTVALNNLQGMIGVNVDAEDLEPVPDAMLVAPPDLDAVEASLAGHPQLLQARQGLELATLGVQMLDPSYASRAQIESARTQLLTTEQLVEEATRGFTLQARNLLIQAQSAVEAYTVERSNLDNAEQRLAFQEDRLRSGLISQVALDQTRLQTEQAKLAALRARNDVLRGLLALQAGTLVSLDGPTVLDAAAAMPPSEDADATR